MQLKILPICFLLAGIACSAQKGSTLQETSTPVAFPGAEGFGKYTTGGRGGKVYVWIHQLTEDEVKNYTLQKIFNGWIPE